MAKSTTSKQKKDFIREHYPYERDMLRGTFAELKAPSLSQVFRNALIESFCVHARNLIEFFKNKDSCDFDPRNFTEQDYRLQKKFIGDSILPKITGTVSHLSRNRTSEKAEKINMDTMRQICKAIEGEITRFEQGLVELYKSELGGQNLPKSVALISTASTASATNHIGVIQTKT